jgi:hypothetical protein
MTYDEYIEHRADFHTIPGDQSDKFEKYWLTCTFCGRQSPPINNGDDVCPYCNSETVYLETEAEYDALIAKMNEVQP